MHRIDNNASCASRVWVFAALSAVVVLAAASSPALAEEHEHHHTTFAFVTASASSNLYMVDLTTYKAVAQIPKDGPLQTVTTRDGTTTYSVDTSDSAVTYTENNETGVENDPDRIRVEEGPFGLAISLDGTKLFVFSTSKEGNTVSVIDTSQNEVVEKDPAPAYHFAITVTANGHLAAVN